MLAHTLAWQSLQIQGQSDGGLQLSCVNVTIYLPTIFMAKRALELKMAIDCGLGIYTLSSLTTPLPCILSQVTCYHSTIIYYTTSSILHV